MGDIAGERTPDTSPPGKAGSTDDEISLREHLQRQMDLHRYDDEIAHNELRRHYDSILEERSLFWNTRIDDLVRLIDERYERGIAHNREQWAQHTHQTDVAFQAASAATDVAFKAANRSIEQAHESTQAAIGKVERALDERFNAQATALSKAELATEKRFDAVNEFRAQLSDQATTFMPRSESEVRAQGLAEKVEANAERMNKLELRVSSRLDLNEGKGLGSSQTVAWIFAAAGFVGTVAAMAIALTNK